MASCVWSLFWLVLVVVVVIILFLIPYMMLSGYTELSEDRFERPVMQVPAASVAPARTATAAIPPSLSRTSPSKSPSPQTRAASRSRKRSSGGSVSRRSTRRSSRRRGSR